MTADDFEAYIKGLGLTVETITGADSGRYIAVMSFTISGPDYYPSAAYSWLINGSADAANVSNWGVGPADGFVGYVAIVGRAVPERWGDYSAAVADPSGNIWFATETINQSCDLDQFLSTSFTCGGTRTIFANWGTTISRVTP